MSFISVKICRIRVNNRNQENNPKLQKAIITICYFCLFTVELISFSFLFCLLTGLIFPNSDKMAYIDKIILMFIIVQVAVIPGKPYDPENDDGEKIKRLARK